jgi:uncharacterized membrane protein (UPF0136 family)
MSNVLVFYYLLFGILTIVGGVIGFIKAGSKPSLIAGGVSGLLLLIAAILVWNGSGRWGLILALVVSVLLAGRFVPAFVKKKAWMPGGMMSVLSVIGVLLGVAGFVA